MPIHDHVFGTRPELDIRVMLAALLNMLGGTLTFRAEHLNWAKGDVKWVLAPGIIRVRLIHRRWARRYKIGESRFEDVKACLAVALSRLGGEVVIRGDDLQFEAGDVGYLMEKKGDTFHVKLARDKGKVTTIGAQGAGERAIVLARA